MKYQYSLIILAYTRNKNDFDTTQRCIDSLYASLKNTSAIQLIIVESGNYKHDTYTFLQGEIIGYDKKDFNFHRGLNLGLKAAKGELIAFCNNDVIFYKNWLEIIALEMDSKNIDAASPVDPLDTKLWMYVSNNLSSIEGYEVQKHFKGWCFVVNKNVFKTIPSFDERFDFYFADFDFIMELKVFGFKHAVVLESKVHHLEKKQSADTLSFKELLSNIKMDRSLIPDYVMKEERSWLIQNDKMVDGLIRFHSKWGSQKILRLKLALLNKSNGIGLRSLFSRILFVKQRLRLTKSR